MKGLSFDGYKKAVKEAYRSTAKQPSVFFGQGDGFFTWTGLDRAELERKGYAYIGEAYYTLSGDGNSLKETRKEYAILSKALRKFFAGGSGSFEDFVRAELISF